jgi:hypothetical protein
MRWARRHTQPILAVIFLLLAVPLLAQNGSVPHSHGSATPALFNQEHDLTLLATGGAATLADIAPLVVGVVLIAVLSTCVPHRPIVSPCRGADSRAPPVR